VAEGTIATVVVLAGRVPSELLAHLEGRFPELNFVSVPPEGPIADSARDATVLLTAGQPTPALKETVDALQRLEWVHTISAGVDRHLPVIAGRPVRFTRTAGARAVPIAEHVLAMTLALLKRVPDLLNSQRRREWRRSRPLDLAGATVGIVGAGAVGREAAVRFKAFGTRTIGLRRSGGPAHGFDTVWPSDHLEDLLIASDVVVVACPLTPRTKGLLGGREFELMRPGAYLVNVARGGIVVEEDLVAALQGGRLGGAALDVFEVEPLPAESPLWGMSNVIVSPHSASASPTVWDSVVEEFAENLTRYLSGAPLANVVDVEERGY